MWRKQRVKVLLTLAAPPYAALYERAFVFAKSLSMAICAAANAFGTPGGSKYMVRADVMPGWLDASLSGEAEFWTCGMLSAYAWVWRVMPLYVLEFCILVSNMES